MESEDNIWRLKADLQLARLVMHETELRAERLQGLVDEQAGALKARDVQLAHVGAMLSLAWSADIPGICKRLGLEGLDLRRMPAGILPACVRSLISDDCYGWPARYYGLGNYPRMTERERIQAAALYCYLELSRIETYVSTSDYPQSRDLRED